MKPEISIALCADRNIEVGLHVTLHSLLQSQLHPVRINLFQKGYLPRDIDKLHKTLKPYHGNYELNVIDFDDHEFSGYKGLHGNKFAFTRIMIANYLKDERVIYLDSDLVVRKNLAPLFFENLNGHAIGVSGVGNIEWSLEHAFFTSLGLKKEAKYFNSGVMLIDLEKWRKLKITKRCFEFADKYPNMLLTADQTILNYVFYENNFHVLDKSYNHALYPNSKPILPDESGSIFHFVGSPKPWDYLGEIVHRNYPLFHRELSRTEFRNYKSYLDFSLYRIKRTVRLARAYYICLTDKHE